MRKILIIEDEALIALVIKQKLEEQNYIISDVKHTGEGVIHSIAENKPDIILMDIKLKGNLDGIDVAKKIKEKYNIDIIFITGNFDETTEKRALETEPVAFVEKPISYEKLFKIIESIKL